MTDDDTTVEASEGANVAIEVLAARIRCLCEEYHPSIGISAAFHAFVDMALQECTLEEVRRMAACEFEEMMQDNPEQRAS